MFQPVGVLVELFRLGRTVGIVEGVQEQGVQGDRVLKGQQRLKKIENEVSKFWVTDKRWLSSC